MEEEVEMEKYIDEELDYETALELIKIKGSKLMDLFSAANKTREKYCGDKLMICTITNAKSGKCSEDCKFCAQSSHYNTDVKTYDLKDKETIEEERKRAYEIGAKSFGLVTSGKSIKKGSRDFEEIKSFLKNSDKKEEIELCASIGLLNYEEANELKEAGLQRYHCNIQTSVDKYSELIAKTHSIEDRLEAIKNAKRTGLNVCSGGIIGMGETDEDRVKMAFTLKDLGVDSVPLNILNPIKGTPYGEREILSADEILKTIAVYRLILKDRIIKIAAGRENIIKDFMGMAFMCGANGMLIGGYLTIKGRSIEEDKKLIENIKKMWS